jgi:hypothetical protein
LTSTSTDTGLAFRVSRRVAVPAAEVWREMQRPGHLTECHPFCQRNEPERWPGVGSRDAVHYYNGKVIHRNFLTWEEGRGYLVYVTDERERRVLDAEFLVAPAPGDPRASIMTIRGSGVPSRILPDRVRRVMWQVAERALIERYFDAVIQGFEFHLTTGKTVGRSQFGWLPLFS